jgi:serine/threonine-protein kinase
MFLSDRVSEPPPSRVDVGGFEPEVPSRIFLQPRLDRDSSGSVTEVPPLVVEHGTDGATSEKISTRSAEGLSSGRVRRARDPELPPIGAIIDKYRIEEILGVGGFAAVYRATHMLLQMPVAIKLLRPRVVRKDPALAAALCEEARFAARINHPNVVRVFDVTHRPELTYVVMEYIRGPTLGGAIESQGRLPMATVLSVGVDVAMGLRAGLEQGLIHRDVKPANILLSREGPAKVVDLGLARSSSASPSQQIIDPSRRIAVLGTPAYMAPEQSLDSESVDLRADIYSLGVSLYHASVGSTPFPYRDVHACLEMHRKQLPPLPESRFPDFPPVVSKLLLRMLAKQPDQRPPSYDVLIQLLREAQEVLRV